VTTHPPERIIIDVETEGEFLNHEQSEDAPGATASAPTTTAPAPPPAWAPGSPPALSIGAAANWRPSAPASRS
jgi:hypothetical protein